MTLFEVLLAMFIFSVGIVGVLVAMPTGVSSAEQVILQDAAINLAHSKFAEFRRDRVDPAVDLQPNSNYLSANNCAVGGTPDASTDATWYVFQYTPASGYTAGISSPTVAGSPYEYFDDIERYEWNLKVTPISASAAVAANTPPPIGNRLFPIVTAISNIGLYQATIRVRFKGSRKEYHFSQLMCAYGRYPGLFDPKIPGD